MATVIPNLSTLRNMTPGERRLGQRLETVLEDDYTIWYDITLGHQSRHADIVRVIAPQKEQVARLIGAGLCVIHGVSGSGKTLILSYRCPYLAHFIAKPILLLRFRITQAARLPSFIAENGIEDRVPADHFHEWCAQQRRTYNVDLIDGDAPYWEREVKKVIQIVDEDQIPCAQYSVLMSDDGYDLEQEWLRPMAQMIDPDIYLQLQDAGGGPFIPDSAGVCRCH